MADLENSRSQRDFEYCRCFKVEEVKGVMHKMSRGRPIRPKEIQVEFRKSTDMASLEWLTRLFNVIFRQL